jgi:nitrogen fixation/metabolism regulation signal transduction histidine kinase
MAKEKTGYRRRRNLIMPKTQILLLIWLVCAVAIGFAIGQFADVAYSLLTDYSADEGGIGGSFVVIAGAAMALSLVTLLLLVGLVGSNHLVGPVYRTLEMLKRIEAGDYDCTMRLRKGDAFPELTDRFNNALAALRAERDRNKAS